MSNKNIHSLQPQSIIDIPQPKKIKVDYSTIHGRGIFATEDILTDELIERCPMVQLAHRVRYHNDSQLFTYLYTQKCPCEECNNHGAIFLMVLGYGMLYNHQDIPNTVWKFKHDFKVADVIAVRPIKKGEEIFVSYGNRYFQGRKKITLNEDEPIESVAKILVMPDEWKKWIKDSIEFGVPIFKIKETLISNRFDTNIINQALDECSHHE